VAESVDEQVVMGACWIVPELAVGVACNPHVDRNDADQTKQEQRASARAEFGPGNFACRRH
jgi:hypothetical protein